jgi:hypothetical protein
MRLKHGNASEVGVQYSGIFRADGSMDIHTCSLEPSVFEKTLTLHLRRLHLRLLLHVGALGHVDDICFLYLVEMACRLSFAADES